MFNIFKKKSKAEEQVKLLITSRGYSGTIFLLSMLSGLKNSIVAWKGPNKIALFGKNGRREEQTSIAEKNEIQHVSPVEVFSRLREMDPISDLFCIGHWLDLHHVETHYGYAYLKKNNIKLINLIRHPIDRTHSNWHALRTTFSQTMPEEHKKGFIGTLNNQKEWLDDFLIKHKISLDEIKDLTFIGACLNLFPCSIDASYSKYTHLKLETLNKKTLASLLTSISNKKINLTEMDLETVNPDRNSHISAYYQNTEQRKKEDIVPMNTHEKYLSWLPWQQELYKTCVIKSKLNKHYKQFDYELYL